MRTSSFVIFLIFLVQAFSANANSKFAFVVGGSDDPIQKETIFDNDFDELVENLISADYQIFSAFNGENVQTLNRVVKPWIQKKKISWLPANLENIHYFQKTIKDQIKRDDQLLIVLIGHGAPRIQGQQTHGFEINQGQQWNLDQLKAWIDPLIAKGVRTALIDSSCRSGTSLDIGTPQLCVMSSSNSESLGYYNFMRAFNKELRLRKICWMCSTSLDHIFLKTRREMVMSTPLISIDSNEQIMSATEGFQIIVNHYLAQKAIYWSFGDKGPCPTCYSRTFPQHQMRLEKARHIFESGVSPGVDSSSRRDLVKAVDQYIKTSQILFSASTNPDLDPSSENYSQSFKALGKIQDQAYRTILKYERHSYEWAYRKSRSESIKEPCSQIRF